MQGGPAEDVFTCDALIASKPGEIGLEPPPRHTDCRRGRSFACWNDGSATTLLEVRPLTYRTNQIRVHLWQLGFPICGDPAYRTGGILGKP